MVTRGSSMDPSGIGGGGGGSGSGSRPGGGFWAEAAHATSTSTIAKERRSCVRIFDPFY
jgi:hypothetical protein